MAASLQEFVLGTYGVNLLYEVRESDTALNISAATNLKFFLVNPRGETIEKTATFYTDGTDGILKYAWVAADLPRASKWLVGAWIVQPEFTLSGFNGAIDAATFYVRDCLRKT